MTPSRSSSVLASARYACASSWRCAFSLRSCLRFVRRSLGDGVSDAVFDEGLAFFYEYYREHMLDNTCLYPGVQEGLDQLLAQGARMAVLTNKPVRFSQMIVGRLGLNEIGILDADLPRPVAGRTLFAGIGNWSVAFLIFCAAVATFVLRRIFP